MSRTPHEIDMTVLVDIVSNAAGMMVMFACLAVLVHGVQNQPAPRQAAKPINYPLSYLPVKKSSVTVALKNGRFYRLPGAELLEQVTAKTAHGGPVDWLEIEKEGVHGRLELTETALGYRFQYNLLPGAGVPTTSLSGLKDALDRLIKDYPPERYFVMVHVWPDDFQAFRDVREYLIEKKVEVGWHPRLDLATAGAWDITLAIGEYNEGFSSIKAQ